MAVSKPARYLATRRITVEKPVRKALAPGDEYKDPPRWVIECGWVVPADNLPDTPSLSEEPA